MPKQTTDHSSISGPILHYTSYDESSRGQSRKRALLPKVKAMLTKGVAPIRSTLLLVQLPNLLVNQVIECAEEYIAYAVHLENIHGLEYCCKHLKALNSMTNRARLTLKVEQLGPFSMALDYQGYPTLIKSKMPQLWNLLTSGKTKNQRNAFTILRMFELIRLEPKFDVESIKETTQALEGYMGKLEHKLLHKSLQHSNFRESYIHWLTHSKYGRGKKRRYEEELEQKRKTLAKEGSPYYFSTKTGPRGFALGTLGKQAKDISETLKQLLCRLGNITGLQRFEFALTESQNGFDQSQKDPDQGSEFYNIDRGLSGRLDVYPDKGGKHRLMAICNTWIQMPLRPLHDVLMKVLIPLITDSSFDQEAGAKRVKDATGRGKVTSLDLSDATNKILAEMQCDSFMAMDNKLEDWLTLVKGMVFYNPDVGEGVRYGTGQPMGLYTSFAALAHWHNDIYRFASFLITGNLKEDFSSFQILGDDSACWDEQVTEMYMYLCTQLCIPIAYGKSLISTSEIHAAEFAKRTFYEGRDITGISPTLALSVFGRELESSLAHLPLLLESLSTREWMSEGLPLTFVVFKRAIKSALPRVTDRTIQTHFLCSQIALYTRARRLSIKLNTSWDNLLIGNFQRNPLEPDIDWRDILSSLVELKRENITRKIGGQWSSIPMLRKKIIEETQVSISYKTLNQDHYSLGVTDLVLKGFHKLCERSAMSSFVPLDIVELVTEIEDIETLRTVDKGIFIKPKGVDNVRKSRRELQLNQLYKLVDRYTKEW